MNRSAVLVVLSSLAIASGSAAAERDRSARIEVAEKVVLSERVLGFRRSYRFFAPEVDAAEPLPLVVALHGGVATSKIFERQSGLTELAARSGEFAVVYPNGIGIFSALRHWNGGFCCAKAMRAGIDDVAFLDRVIDDVAERVSIDRERIYFVGYSNGGMLAYLYAARRGELVAGVGVFGSSVGLTGEGGGWLPPDPTARIPMTLFHGRDDPRLPLAGRPGRSNAALRTLGPIESAEFWAAVNGCDAPPVERAEAWGESLDWCPRGDAPIRLQLLEDWGHDWPGPHFTLRVDRAHPVFGYDAAERMWLFFREHGGSR